MINLINSESVFRYSSTEKPTKWENFFVSILYPHLFCLPLISNNIRCSHSFRRTFGKFSRWIQSHLSSDMSSLSGTSVTMWFSLKRYQRSERKTQCRFGQTQTSSIHVRYICYVSCPVISTHQYFVRLIISIDNIKYVRRVKCCWISTNAHTNTNRIENKAMRVFAEAQSEFIRFGLTIGLLANGKWQISYICFW